MAMVEAYVLIRAEVGRSAEVADAVTFGPSTSKLVPRAVAYARAHAEEVLEVEPGVWQGPRSATFRRLRHW
jgi:hypothetical protein